MNIVTRSTRQPTATERMAEFKARAVYVPELNFVIGNQFYKKFKDVK